jgi:hypothetical protein
LDLRCSWLTPLILAGKGLVWMALGTVLAPCGLVAGFHVFVKAVRYVAYGTGLIAGLVGTRYKEYEKTHGG